MQRLIRAGVLLAVIVGALAGVGRSAPGAEAAGPGTWTYAADMPEAFATKSGVLLRDGSVLYAAGGTNPYEPPPGGAMRYYPATDTWIETGPNVAPRIFATATLLRDGRVFLAGGIDSSTCCFTPVTTTEFYNPNTNTWSPGPNMPIGQALHEAVLTVNGRVVLIGGQVHISSCLKTVQIYDPATNTIGVAADMVEDRASLGAVLLPDGRILAAGGATPCFGGDTNSTAEIYNPFTNSWTAVASMADRRIGFDMTLLPDGRAMAVGGSGPSSAVYGSEIYDPVSDTWTPTGAMNTNRAGASAVLLGNGNVLAAGGAASGSRLASAEMYDPASDTWTLVGPLNQARTFFTMTVLPDGRVLAAGGEVAGSTPTATAELWDPTSWRAVAPMAGPRGGHTLTVLQDGRAIATGGVDNSTELDTTEIYDSAQDAWTASGLMPWATLTTRQRSCATARFCFRAECIQRGYDALDPAPGAFVPTPDLVGDRHGSTATLLKDGRVLIFGSPDTAVAEIYDPTTSTVTQTAAAPSPRVYHSATLLDDGRVLIAGGYHFINSIGGFDPWIYDPVANAWTVVPGGHTFGFTYPAAVRLADGDVLMVGGGAIEGEEPLTDLVSIFDAASNTWTAGPNLPSPHGARPCCYTRTTCCSPTTTATCCTTSRQGRGSTPVKLQSTTARLEGWASFHPARCCSRAACKRVVPRSPPVPASTTWGYTRTPTATGITMGWSWRWGSIRGRSA